MELGFDECFEPIENFEDFLESHIFASLIDYND